jgi:hypothetical protein
VRSDEASRRDGFFPFFRFYARFSNKKAKDRAFAKLTHSFSDNNDKLTLLFLPCRLLPLTFPKSANSSPMASSSPS